MKEKVNIFEFLPSIDLYNPNSYMSCDTIDMFSIYPDIYKQIGKYIYNTWINSNLNNQEISYQKVLHICNEVFEYLSSNFKYITEDKQLLKDCILIVVLVELERNNYKINV